MSKKNKPVKKNEVAEKEVEKVKKKLSWVMHRRSIAVQNDYIKNKINGRYYFERCNMIAEQVLRGKIQENIDGCPKPKSYMRAEYALMKLQAISSMRSAHFAKGDLMKDFHFTENDILAIEVDYYDGKIIREDYDESHKKRNKAKFVKTP